MRKNWQAAIIKPASTLQIKQMCIRIWGQDDYMAIEQMTHGRSHQNHRITLANGADVILRITSNEKSLQKQYALAQKLWQKLPVPRFLSAPIANNDQQYFAFLEYKRGHRLANLEQLPTADQAQLGFELGEYLAMLHSQKFKSAGEFNAELKLTQSYDVSANGMADIFKQLSKVAVQNGYISTAQSRNFGRLFEQKIMILDDWHHHHCLLHADLNEDNILHYDGHISAILDWEFSLSGHPALDFGKFTRTPYDNCPIFTENLCDSYYLTHKNLPTNWHDIAKIVDLMAWAEFLSRPKLHDDVKMSAINKLTSLLGD